MKERLADIASKIADRFQMHVINPILRFSCWFVEWAGPCLSKRRTKRDVRPDSEKNLLEHEGLFATIEKTEKEIMRNELIRKTKAIIFDMDGVLLDTERLHMKARREAMKELGCILSEELTHTMMGQPEPVCQRMLLDELPQVQAERLFIRYKSLFHKYLRETAIPPIKAGVFETLDYLDALRMPRAVATSAGYEAAVHNLSLAGIFQRVAFVVGADQVERGKPAPDVFLKVARELNVLPEACIVLEDSEAGIRGAHAAGMMPIMLQDMKAPSEEIRALTIAVFDSMAVFLERFQKVMALELVH